MSYQNILNGKGYGIGDARQSITIAHQIRNQKISAKTGTDQIFIVYKAAVFTWSNLT
jgi:hypothetical protein